MTAPSLRASSPRIESWLISGNSMRCQVEPASSLRIRVPPCPAAIAVFCVKKKTKVSALVESDGKTAQPLPSHYDSNRHLFPLQIPQPYNSHPRNAHTFPE